MKYGVGLFIVREQAERDIFGVLERIRELGYDGVELLGFYGKTPAQLREKAASLSLELLGNHVPLRDFAAAPDRVIAEHLEAGCRHITIGWPDRTLLPGKSGTAEAAKQLGELSRRCVEAGITPLYHNHDFEFAAEPSLLDYVLDKCADSGLCFEPDVGWMAFMGIDPVYYLEKYRERIPVVHLKDIYADDIAKVGSGMELSAIDRDPAKGGFAFRPVGYGIVNMPRLLPYCLACDPKWLMVDHDLAYDRDSYSDLDKSLTYIKDLMLICN